MTTTSYVIWRLGPLKKPFFSFTYCVLHVEAWLVGSVYVLYVDDYMWIWLGPFREICVDAYLIFY
jgi:hypothetical protein